jgi:hypothetical protein
MHGMNLLALPCQRQFLALRTPPVMLAKQFESCPSTYFTLYAPLCTLPEFIPTLPPDTTSPALYNLYSLQSAFFQIIDSRWQGLELRIALFFCFAYYYSFSMCILLMHLVQAT